MNLDLLKKLVKLANNNPNENEANSAARRVCRIIEEGNFNFGNSIVTKPRPGSFDSKHWDDIFRDLYTQPKSKSKPPETYICADCKKTYPLPRFAFPLGPRYCDDCIKKRKEELHRNMGPRWYDEPNKTCPSCKADISKSSYHVCYK